MNRSLNLTSASMMIDRNLTAIMDNPYAKAIIACLMTAYAAAALKLPDSVAKLIQSTAGNVVVMFVTAYAATKNVRVAVVGALGVVALNKFLNTYDYDDRILSKIGGWKVPRISWSIGDTPVAAAAAAAPPPPKAAAAAAAMNGVENEYDEGDDGEEGFRPYNSEGDMFGQTQ